MSAADPDSVPCECGHMRGIHKAATPRPCATAGCGCGAFRVRRPGAPVTPEPPRAIPGRVERELPAGAPVNPEPPAPLKAAPPAPPESSQGGDAARNFAVNLAARMRAQGLTVKELGLKTGMGNAAVGIALGNGSRCTSLAVAEKLAAAVGGYLAVMLGPYRCATCAGEPPPGFRCLECGTEATAS